MRDWIVVMIGMGLFVMAGVKLESERNKMMNARTEFKHIEIPMNSMKELELKQLTEELETKYAELDSLNKEITRAKIIHEYLNLNISESLNDEL